ncbi:MAG: GHKL domain-containing protein [Lachnospiraceae bacterium]|nr:GHKL domain-containing protein [Lachnospiraceae bacterium]
MFPCYRIVEIILYSLINFIPFLVLALYAFYGSLRFPKPITLFLVVILSLLQAGCGFLATLLLPEEKGMLNVLSTSVYFLFYFIAVKAHLGKVLFTLLMLSNIANLVVVLSKCAEGLIFPETAAQPYRWSFSVVMLAMECIFLIPLYFYIRRFFTEMMKKEEKLSVWRYLWAIPATFYLIWSYHLYGGMQSALEQSLNPANAFFLLCINLGAFLVYHIVVCLMDEYDKNFALKAKNAQLALQKLQYENMKNKISETRQARHDLHHHIAVLSGYLHDGRLEELESYLAGYLNSMPDDSSIVFCQNYEVNLLLCYFSQQAKERQVDFLVHADIPENLGVDEVDISVLLGNLLENALDACILEENIHKKIVVRGQTKNNTLFLTIDNTFHGKVKKDKNGRYLSSKHEGEGIGIESAKQIVLCYHGIFQVDCEDGLFCVSVMLPLDRD